MIKTFFVIISTLIICSICNTACLGGEDDVAAEEGRYRVYSSSGAQAVTVLLDTKTGKMWQLSTDMTGKLKVEGVTVEGLAFSRSDNETLQRLVSSIDLNNVVEKDRPVCRDKLLSVFSYGLDDEKVERVMNKYLKKGN